MNKAVGYIRTALGERVDSVRLMARRRRSGMYHHVMAFIFCIQSS